MLKNQQAICDHRFPSDVGSDYEGPLPANDIEASNDVAGNVAVEALRRLIKQPDRRVTQEETGERQSS